MTTGRTRRDLLHGAGAALILPTLAGLLACGTAAADPDGLDFDVRRIEVGYESAAVLILNGQGAAFPDVLVTGGGRVTVLRGGASGELRVREVIAAGEHPVDLAAGDLNEDGRLDLVIANHETRYLTLLFGAPDGFSAGRAERLPIDVSPHPHAVAIADLDGDGHPDIVVDDRDRDRLAVYRGDGTGAFEPGAPIPVGGDPYRGMTLADLDGDGHLDVVTPNPRSVAVQLGDGAGGFSPGPRLESAAMPPFGTTVGDFNDDGAPDIAAGSGEARGRVMVWLGSGEGSFERAPGAPYDIADGPTRLRTGDVNGDGLDDVLVTSYLGDEVALLLGGRDELRLVRIALDDYPWDVAAGDLNGDGRVDLVTANDGGTSISVLIAGAP